MKFWLNKMVWFKFMCPFISRNLFNHHHNIQFIYKCENCFLHSVSRKQNFVSTTEIATLTTCPSIIQVRHYAKGKDKKKEKGKKIVKLNEEELSSVINVESMRNHMKMAIDDLKGDYMKQLSLRSSTGSLENLTIKFEDKEYPFQELAKIVRKNPKTMVVDMSVFPQAIPNALEAIEKSGMNLNPQQDGTTLFIPVPKVTKEHREMLAKNAKVMFINCRDSVKDVQNKYIRTVKNKEKDGVSQDLSRGSQEQIIAIGETYIEEAKKIFDLKTEELIGKEE